MNFLRGGAMFVSCSGAMYLLRTAARSDFLAWRRNEARGLMISFVEMGYNEGLQQRPSRNVISPRPQVAAAHVIASSPSRRFGSRIEEGRYVYYLLRSCRFKLRADIFFIEIDRRLPSPRNGFTSFSVNFRSAARKLTALFLDHLLGACSGVRPHTWTRASPR
ncbi:uncharacterized protein SCHCODRAFT_02095260 [Schizophyllum commune H4-8]|uniref:uncharacterized protein n=1 Tax=Schizophyllum commune (strain H4-8 / FGSC 9210) TaxID=578458 RepID=UPI00215E3438|nr:uncharacterized protein SCHCODRAFT_02095260 [Schizophyllum commune H4-8]KAI5886339.1 hypothetical protein SCHCODRAFT_02095260 [Schizophyllum commune H4-8]